MIIIPDLVGCHFSHYQQWNIRNTR
jgi:hypothetical protein